MDEFTKTKIGYTIALLAVAFAIYPLIESNKSIGFTIFGSLFSIQSAYFLAVSLLALAVYFISLQFISSKRALYFDTASNLAYALSLIIPALYVSLWALILLTNWLSNIVTYIPPVVWNFTAGAITALIGNYGVLYINKSLTNKDAKSKQDENKKQEIVLLARAEELIIAGHYDLSLLESSKIIEMALRQSISLTTNDSKLFSMHNLIERAKKLEIIPQKDIEEVVQVRQLRNNTSHLDTPISKAQAVLAIKVAKRLVKTLSYSHNVKGITWLQVNESNVLKALSGKNPALLESVKKHLWDAWIERDGAVSGEISIFFETALIKQPEIIVSIFSQNSDQFNLWLNQIQTQMFTDFIGGKKELLEKLKDDITQSLTDYIKSTEKGKSKTIASKILNAISSVEIVEVH